MDKLKKLKAAYAAKVAEMEAALQASDGRTMTDEESTAFEALDAEAKSITAQIATEEIMVKARAEAERQAKLEAPVLDKQIDDGNTTVLDDPTQAAGGAAGAAATQASKPIVIPARVSRMSGRLDSFVGANAQERAYKAGMWFRAVAGNQAAAKWCEDHGMPIEFTNLQSEGVNTDGGYLVPLELDRDIIRLVESFGIFRQKARRVPMMGDTKDRNRRTGGVTAYFTGEGAAATASTMTWDQIKLVAKKLTAISTITDELNSDAIISIADELVREIALAFAEKEDTTGFVGTGISTHGGITGISTKLTDINGVDDGGGLVLAAGNLFSEISLTNFDKMTGQTINIAGAVEEWYCSKPFWSQTMRRLENAAGGNTVRDIKDGNGRMLFGGFPVNFVNVMPKTDANSQVACLFGDLRLSSDFGDRQGQTISFSRDATVGSVSMFESGQLAVKGVERYDINNHDLGTSTVGGPVVGLITAAS